MLISTSGMVSYMKKNISKKSNLTYLEKKGTPGGNPQHWILEPSYKIIVIILIKYTFLQKLGQDSNFINGF